MHFTFQSFFCFYAHIYMNVNCILFCNTMEMLWFSSHQQKMLKYLKFNSEVMKPAVSLFSGK